jgi:hypothetical protein
MARAPRFHGAIVLLPRRPVEIYFSTLEGRIYILYDCGERMDADTFRIDIVLFHFPEECGKFDGCAGANIHLLVVIVVGATIECLIEVALAIVQFDPVTGLG